MAARRSDLLASRSARRRAWRKHHPRLEQLEQRLLLSIQPLPSPLERLLPEGSLARHAELAGALEANDLTDDYTVPLAGGSKLSAFAAPQADALNLELSLRDPSGNVVASVDNTGPGGGELLSDLPIAINGTYTLRVSGGASVGNYTLRVLVNGQFEAEALGLASNDTRNSPQDIDPSAVPVFDGIDRLYVAGNRSDVIQDLISADFESATHGFNVNNRFGQGNGQWHITTRRGAQPGHSGGSSFYFGAGGDGGYAGSAEGTITSSLVDLREAEGRVELSFNYFLDAEPFLDEAIVEIVSAGQATRIADNSTIGNLANPSEGFQALTLDVSEFIGKRIQVRFHFVSDPFVEGEGWYVDDVVLRNFGLPPDDYYQVSLTAGIPASVTLFSEGARGMSLELLDAQGQVLALGDTFRGASGTAINRFVPQATGPYHLRVYGATGGYGLLVTRGADFEREWNQGDSGEPHTLDGLGFTLGSVGTLPRPLQQEVEPNDDGVSGISVDDLPFANDISGDFGETQNGSYRAVVTGEIALGALPESDFFRFQATPGDQLSVTLEGLSLADPFMWLLNRDGNVLAFDDDSAGSLDSRIDFGNFVYAGDYYLVAESFDFSGGTYRLTADIRTSDPRVASDDDHYAISAAAGDVLIVTATRTGTDRGQFEPINGLLPALALLDRNGDTITEGIVSTDGSRAILAYGVPVDDTYTVVVSARDDTEGDYLLDVRQGVGPAPPLFVKGSSPADGSHLPQSPSEVVLEFSEPILVASLSTSDLLVNGQPLGASAQLLSARAARFTLPNLTDGIYRLEVPQGALTDLQGHPQAAFNSTFTVDTVAPRVIGVSVQNGSVVNSGPLTVEITFSEAMRPAAALPANVLLSGQIHGNIAPTVVTLDPGTNTLRLGFPALLDDDYTLTLRSGDGQWEDLAGNDLDGEVEDTPIPPNQSGNGQPGGDLTIHFVADTDVAAVPGDFTPVDPLGSLIAQAEFSGAIHAGGDVDTYELHLDAGQYLTTVVSGQGGLAPAVDIMDPQGADLGSALADVTAPALIRNALATVAGVYQIIIRGQAGATGNYDVNLYIDADVEVEGTLQSDNDTLEHAQPIDGPARPLIGDANRRAVVGDQAPQAVTLFAEDFEATRNPMVIDNNYGVGGGQWHRSTGRRNSPGHSPNRAMYFGSGETLDGFGVYRPDVEGLLSTPELDFTGISGRITLSFNYFLDIEDFDTAEVRVILPDDTFDVLGANYDGLLQPFTFDFLPVSFDVSEYAGASIRIGFYFGSDGSVEYEGWYVDDIRIENFAPPTPDWYSVALPAGVSATLLLAARGGAAPRLELFDSQGLPLAMGSGDASNVRQIVSQFAPRRSGDYFIRVTGGNGPYTLMVIRDGDFDRERNEPAEFAQPLAPGDVVLGYVRENLNNEGFTGSQVAAAPNSLLFRERDALSREKLGMARREKAATEAERPGEDSIRRLIVRFQTGARPVDIRKIVESQGYRIVERLDLIQAWVLEAPPNVADIRAEAARWTARDDVVYAEPDVVYRALDTLPNDPDFNALYALRNTGQTGGTVGADIEATAAWDLFRGSRDVVIASIDTGVDYNHPDLFLNTWTNSGEIPGDGVDNDGNGYIDDVHGWDAANNDGDPWDDNGHGTHTSGTMAAVGDNGLGVVGVNWEASIMPLKFLDSFGFGTLTDAVEAITYMVRMKTRYGVNIVASNNSWGGGDFSQSLADAIQASIDAGILFVAAAGNSSVNNDVFPSYPSSYELDGIISVAATDDRDILASFSNFGEDSVDLAAPGVAILSTLPDADYAIFSGTSMAAPHVAGVAALLAGLRPDLATLDIKEAILAGADPVRSLEGRVLTGGRLNAFRTLVPYANPDDWYEIQGVAGVHLAVTAAAPTDASSTRDPLDLVLELYDPSAGFLATSTNSGESWTVAHTPSDNGSILLRVLSRGGNGTYAIQITGQSPVTPRLQVQSTDLADGRALGIVPSEMTVSFDAELYIPSLSASDLTVDGIPGTGFLVVDGSKVTFSLPPLAEGLHTVQMAAAALESVTGGPLAVFSGQFTVDLTAPRIVGSSVLEGDVIDSPDPTIELTFSEPLQTDDLDANDVQLVGTRSGVHPLESFAYDALSNRLSMSFGVLPDDEYTLRLISGDKHFEDLVGNDLDGESPLAGGGVPSGDGSAGGNFEVRFSVDREVLALPEFERVQPFGSLIYEAAGASFLGAAGDTDTWSFVVRAGQLMSVALSGVAGQSFGGRLLAPDGSLLAEGHSAPNSSAIVMPSIPAGIDGVYRVEVEGESAGSVEVRVVLNAVLEREQYSIGSNDGSVTAENLAGTDVVLLDSASRLAVLGSQAPVGHLLYSEDFESGLGGFVADDGLGAGQWHWSAGRGIDLGHSPSHSLYFGAGEGIDGGGAYEANALGGIVSPVIDLAGIHGDIRLELNYFLEIEDFYDLASVEVIDSGTTVILADNEDIGGLADVTGVFRSASLDLTRFGGRQIQIRFLMQSDYSVELEGWYIDDIHVRWYELPSPDVYRLELAQGESIQVSVESSAARDVRVELLAADGTVLRQAEAGALNVATEIRDFHPPESGVYYLRVQGTDRTYSILVTRGSVFDAERNNDAVTAQPLGNDLTAVGYLVGGTTSSGLVGAAPAPESESLSSGINTDVPSSDRLIVRFATALGPFVQVKSAGGVASNGMRRLPLINGLVVDVDSSQETLDEAAARWRGVNGVVGVEVDSILKAAALVPNDPLFSQQYALQNTGQTGGRSGADIAATEAWEYTTGRGDVVVAVVDSGVDYRHEDLALNMWTNPGEIPNDNIDNDRNGYVDDIYGIDVVNNDSDPLDDAGHGTHVAGILGAAGNNGVGVAGVNWQTRVMALKFLDSTGFGSLSGAIQLLEYMTMMKTRYGVNIVVSNNSWGGGGYSQALLDAIQLSNAAGILFVAAAGNESANLDVEPHYPAAYDLPGIISVAATDHNDRLATFSNYGLTRVDIAAPGVGIISTTPGNTYSVYDGTSMAAPYVAGVAALLAEANPSLTAHELKQAILDGAEKVSGLSGKLLTGGRLDALQSMAIGVNPDDWYSFEMAAGDVFHVTVASPEVGAAGDLGFLLDLYGPAGNLLQIGQSGPGANSQAELWHRADQSGQFVVRVASQSGGGEYVLHVRRQDSPAPRVVDFFVSGSDWTQDIFTSLAANGLGEKRFGYAVWPMDPPQDRGLPWSSLDTISIRFSQPVLIEANDLVVRSGSATMRLAADGFHYDAEARVATWVFADPFDADRFLVQLRDDVRSAAGVPLDGERILRGKGAQSGNGVPGGDFLIRLYVTPGDVDGDGAVGLADFSVLKSSFGQSHPFADFDGGGGVDLVDFGALKRHFGETVPIPKLPASPPLPNLEAQSKKEELPLLERDDNHALVETALDLWGDDDWRQSLWG